MDHFNYVSGRLHAEDVPIERIEYHKPLGQGRVVDVQPTDEPNVFYVVMQRGGRRWWEEIDIR